MIRQPDIIRAPNHVGELVMSIPALLAAPAADVIVPPAFASLVALLPITGTIIGSGRRENGTLAAVRAIRAVGTERGHRHDNGVLLTGSFSSALIFRLARVRHVRGINSDSRHLLLDDPVDKSIVPGRPRTSVFYELVTGSWPAEPPVPSISITSQHRERWWQHAGIAKTRTVGIFPGANASARRWDASRFAEVAARLAQDVTVIVFGGPDETALTKIVAGGHAIDMGGKTDLPLLAAALAECDLLITNDSGPIHIAAAVGTPTVSFLGAGDPRETAVIGAAHRLLGYPPLPCVPCVKSDCPRHGAGYVLPDASRECLQIITVTDVLSAAQATLAR